jgi:hypothetical protein
MEYLVYIALAYYALLVFKIIGQLVRVKFRISKFYDERMSLLLGLFVAIHIVAVVLYGFWLVISRMVSVAL